MILRFMVVLCFYEKQLFLFSINLFFLLFFVRNISVCLGSSIQQTEPQPEFLAPLENFTVTQGRECVFTCIVNDLGHYRVSDISIMCMHKPYFLLLDVICLFYHYYYNKRTFQLHQKYYYGSHVNICFCMHIPFSVSFLHFFYFIFYNFICGNTCMHNNNNNFL